MLLTRLLALDTRLLEPDTELTVSFSAEMVMGCTLVTPYGEHVRYRLLLGANKDTLSTLKLFLYLEISKLMLRELRES